jgi:hypothetical protein
MPAVSRQGFEDGRLCELLTLNRREGFPATVNVVTSAIEKSGQTSEAKMYKRICMAPPAGSAPLRSIAQTSSQKVVVASLESFDDHDAKADRKKAKHGEINEHSKPLSECCDDRCAADQRQARSCVKLNAFRCDGTAQT